MGEELLGVGEQAGRQPGEHRQHDEGRLTLAQPPALTDDERLERDSPPTAHDPSNLRIGCASSPVDGGTARAHFAEPGAPISSTLCPSGAQNIATRTSS